MKPPCFQFFSNHDSKLFQVLQVHQLALRGCDPLVSGLQSAMETVGAINFGAKNFMTYWIPDYSTKRPSHPALFQPVPLLTNSSHQPARQPLNSTLSLTPYLQSLNSSVSSINTITSSPIPSCFSDFDTLGSYLIHILRLWQKKLPHFSILPILESESPLNR